jgi:putative peptide zinc metalloprotease protein
VSELESHQGSPGAAATAPPPPDAERPALAAGVELVGELQAGGFAERQWLVRREGTFVQLGELLYRVAEQLDGTHTLEEAAAAVTETTAWQVAPENVRQVIDLKLAPLGLIEAPAAPHGRPREADVSPFRISGRRRLVGATRVDGVARVLAPLFSPIVAVPALALVVVAHVWLYFVHGAGESIHLALYTPAGLLTVLGLALVSTIFHELGHAAALRYSGGRPGAIGGGFYLVYPTLFTDTSDAYRLGRAGRLRTDLGGMYVQLLFASVMTAAAMALGEPVLLAVVVLIDLEVVYQFLPTTRLDGYWAVADALGVPDPLGYLGVRLGAARSAAAQAPALRRPTAAALAAYLIVSLAFVGAVVALTFADLPQIVSRVVSLFRHHATVLHEAVSKHDVLTAAALVVQLLLLALIGIAVCLLVYRAVRAVLGGLVRWAAVPGRTRVAAGAMLAALTAGTAVLWSSGFYWAPKVPVSLSKTATPAGVRTFEIGAHGPSAASISYGHHPPVGGRYATRWQNCGFYASPVPDALAVHSLARGAIWIAYSPAITKPEQALLHTVAVQLPYVLVTPYDGLRSRVVLSAWGKQLGLPSLTDPRLVQFIQAFRLADAAPEHGKPCAGGIGTPQR